MKAYDVGAILLAAGQSSRFGPGNKLAAPLQDRPLVIHAAKTLSSIELGCRITVCSQPLPVDWSALGFEELRIAGGQAMSASIAAGVERMRTTKLKACLIVLADMPFVPASHFNSLISHGDCQLVATGCNNRKMVPALFGRQMWNRLSDLKGDIGARQLLDHAQVIDAPAKWLRDIDTPEHLARLD